MIKKRALTLFASFIFLILLVSFVSAGLCKGSDGYYHDCDDFSDRYYKENFKPNYEIEYSKESSSSSYESEYYKENRWGYEKETTYSYEESNYEKYEKKRDYSYPKTAYNRYINSRYDYGDKYENSDGYDYWGEYDYDYKDKYWRDYYDYDKNRYEWDDEPQLTVFVNKVEPVHYRRRDNGNGRKERDLIGREGELSLTWPYSS